MYIIVLDNDKSNGAISVINDSGEKVIYIFEEKDDANRYAMLMEDEGYPRTQVLEYDDDLIINVCEMTNNKYAIITKDDIVIPVKYNDNIS
jgi:hypothetical protein